MVRWLDGWLVGIFISSIYSKYLHTYILVCSNSQRQRRIDGIVKDGMGWDGMATVSYLSPGTQT